MRAIYVSGAGTPPILADLPVPEAEAGSVLVRVKAAGLNAIDNVIAAGVMADAIPHEYPLILGRDAAGVVEAVGDGVEHVAVGDRVVAHVSLGSSFRHGTLAEFAVLPAATVVVIPEELDFTTAAAIPLAGAAAHSAVEASEAHPGAVALVNGATGGVGGYVVQLLAAKGVTVIATGTSADAERLTARGAARVVDYTAGDVATQIRTHYPDGADVLIELVAQNPDASPLDAVRAGGRVVSTTGHPDDATLAARGLSGTTVYAATTGDVIGDLARSATSGELTVDVTTVLSLENALDGLETIKNGTARGKIVVAVGA